MRGTYFTSVGPDRSWGSLVFWYGVAAFLLVVCGGLRSGGRSELARVRFLVLLAVVSDKIRRGSGGSGKQHHPGSAEYDGACLEQLFNGRWTQDGSDLHQERRGEFQLLLILTYNAYIG